MVKLPLQLANVLRIERKFHNELKELILITQKIPLHPE